MPQLGQIRQITNQSFLSGPSDSLCTLPLMKNLLQTPSSRCSLLRQVRATKIDQVLQRMSRTMSSTLGSLTGRLSSIHHRCFRHWGAPMEATTISLTRRHLYNLDRRAKIRPSTFSDLGRLEVQVFMLWAHTIRSIHSLMALFRCRFQTRPLHLTLRLQQIPGSSSYRGRPHHGSKHEVG